MGNHLYLSSFFFHLRYLYHVPISLEGKGEAALNADPYGLLYTVDVITDPAEEDCDLQEADVVALTNIPDGIDDVYLVEESSENVFFGDIWYGNGVVGQDSMAVLSSWG